jgi:hypothetical protein
MKNSKKENEHSPEDIFGPVIHAYARAEAIADAVLFDVSGVAREAGIRFPTAITAAVHARYVQVPDELKGLQDEAGRLWDVLHMFRYAVRSGKLNGNEGTFELIVAMPDRADWQRNERRHGHQQRLVTLKAVCGPNDDGSACITILMPGED